MPLITSLWTKKDFDQSHVRNARDEQSYAKACSHFSTPSFWTVDSLRVVHNHLFLLASFDNLNGLHLQFATPVSCTPRKTSV